MHTQTFDDVPATRPASLVEIGLLRWFQDRVHALGVAYELDGHLARDIGADSYTVPLFPVRAQGDR